MPMRPAVGVAQQVEDLLERRHVAPGQAVGHEPPGQVPDGEPVGQRVELGVYVGRLGGERVEVGHQVAADPVHVDERLHVDLLHQPAVVLVGQVVGGRAVGAPAGRLVGDAHGGEHVVVEVVLPRQVLGHLAQEKARLRPLDDAVVVGRGDREDLAQAELGDDPRVRRLEPGGVTERADPDDRPLAGHEPRHRLHRAERARVGQAHRRAGEVLRRDAIGVHLAHEVLVGEHEGPEVERVRVADAGDEQRPRPVALLDVDRQAEPDVLVPHDAGLARPVEVLDERGVQRGDLAQGPHHGVADQVGETDLGAGRPGQLVVEDLPVDLEQARRDGADARGRRHPEAGLHVGGEARGGSPERDRRVGLVTRRRPRRAPRVVVGTGGGAGIASRTAVGVPLAAAVVSSGVDDASIAARAPPLTDGGADAEGAAAVGSGAPPLSVAPTSGTVREAGSGPGR